MRAWTKASLCSGGVALVGVIAASIVLGGGKRFSPGVTESELENLSYFDAIELLNERSEQISGLDAFLSSLSHPSYIADLAAAWLAVSLMCLAACLLYRKWSGI